MASAQTELRMMVKEYQKSNRAGRADSAAM